MRWILVPDTEEDRSAQRRCFTTGGRRHGWKPDSDEKSESFKEEYLDPAQRGELKEGHSTGIPRTALKSPKGHGIRDDGFEAPDVDEEMMEGDSSLREKGSQVASMNRDIQRHREKVAKKEARALAKPEDKGPVPTIYSVWG